MAMRYADRLTGVGLGFSDILTIPHMAKFGNSHTSHINFFEKYHIFSHKNWIISTFSQLTVS